MTGRYLTGLADTLRGAGLAVVEYDGWQTRARGSGGYADGRPWCVMWHHTASMADPANDAAYCAVGDPDAPVCNLLVDRAGVVWVIAAGCTNTNGKGYAMSFSRGTVPDDQMNTYAVGIEIANGGTGEPYPAAQIDAAFAASLAVCAAERLEPTDVAQHHDWAPDRKIDPATAGAVQGGWRPSSTNSSGSWALDDLRAELTARANLEEDLDMARFIYAFTDYANTFSETGVALTPEAYAAMTAAGAVVIVSADHDQHVESLLHLSGLDRTALIPK